MDFSSFLNWMKEIFIGLSGIGSWLSSPLFTLGDMSFTPLSLLTVSGLTVYITVAFVKWVSD